VINNLEQHPQAYKTLGRGMKPEPPELPVRVDIKAREFYRSRTGFQ